MLFKSVKTPACTFGQVNLELSSQLSERLKQATNIYEVIYGGFLKAKKLGLVVDII